MIEFVDYGDRGPGTAAYFPSIYAATVRTRKWWSCWPNFFGADAAAAAISVLQQTFLVSQQLPSAVMYAPARLPHHLPTATSTLSWWYIATSEHDIDNTDPTNIYATDRGVRMDRWARARA